MENAGLKLRVNDLEKRLRKERHYLLACQNKMQHYSILKENKTFEKEKSLPLLIHCHITTLVIHRINQLSLKRILVSIVRMLREDKLLLTCVSIRKYIVPRAEQNTDAKIVIWQMLIPSTKVNKVRPFFIIPFSYCFFLGPMKKVMVITLHRNFFSFTVICYIGITVRT